MITIFLQYGDDAGRDVGLRFHEYLDRKNLDPFLAGRGSDDIPLGFRDWVTIEQYIINSNILVAICTEGYETSEGVIRELDLWDEQPYRLPIMVLLAEGCQMPQRLQGLQRRRFDPDDFESDFCDWTLEILRTTHITHAKLVAQLYRSFDVPRVQKLFPQEGF